jgi:predicted acyl esterase
MAGIGWNRNGQSKRGVIMEAEYQTTVVKNCLLPMSDGVTLAGDLYRPETDRPVPALLTFTPYHKDDWFPLAYGELMRAMAQQGYACLAVDVRGTGSSGGSTPFPWHDRELRDYYEAVEWAAQQEWCNGRVGVWGKSYGSIATLLTAVENPPHLGAVVGFHGAATRKWHDLVFAAGRERLMETIAQFAPRMTCWNFMPPAFRDPEGRWLTVWKEHLASNYPWAMHAAELAAEGAAESAPVEVAFEQIRAPVYIWAGWRDVMVKEMVDAYRSIKAPKKLTAGPWQHELPDAAYDARIDHLHELRRWFDHWLLDRDTGVMDEPPVSIWVQGADKWVFEDDFPPSEVEELTLYLGPEGTLGREAPSASGGAADSFQYDATAGAYADFRHPDALSTDQRLDDLKGLTYTSPPLSEDMEICGIPEVVLYYSSSMSDTLLVVRLCDVGPDGKSILITEGWLETEQANSLTTKWGHLSEGNASAHLNLVPTAYLLRAGRRLRVSVTGSNFPRMMPNVGPGEIGIKRGEAERSCVQVPVRPARRDPLAPKYAVPREIPHILAKAPLWRIEHDPGNATTTVRIGLYNELAVDGGEAPASVSYAHECSSVASQRQPCQPVGRSESWGRWTSEQEKIEVHLVSVFRPTATEIAVEITLNGAPYWEKRWSRQGALASGFLGGTQDRAQGGVVF